MYMHTIIKNSLFFGTIFAFGVTPSFCFANNSKHNSTIIHTSKHNEVLTKNRSINSKPQIIIIKKNIYTSNHLPIYFINFANNEITAEKNSKNDFHFHKLHALKGNSNSQLFLARCYQKGKFTSRNNNKAFFWYREAARQGNPIAQFHLANCFEKGIGCDKSQRKARIWYEKAAKSENAQAQYHLARLYEKMHGLKYLKKANFWYQKAANNGNKNAQNKLSTIYYSGIVITNKNKKLGKNVPQPYVKYVIKKGRSKSIYLQRSPALF